MQMACDVLLGRAILVVDWQLGLRWHTDFHSMRVNGYVDKQSSFCKGFGSYCVSLCLYPRMVVCCTPRGRPRCSLNACGSCFNCGSAFSAGAFHPFPLVLICSCSVNGPPVLCPVPASLLCTILAKRFAYWDCSRSASPNFILFSPPTCLWLLLAGKQLPPSFSPQSAFQPFYCLAKASLLCLHTHDVAPGGWN